METPLIDTMEFHHLGIVVTKSIEVFQNPPKGELPQSTLIKLPVFRNIEYPYSMRVALLFLAHEHASLTDLNAFSDFKHDLEDTQIDIVRFVSKWSNELDKKSDEWKILSFITSSPKAVAGQPPESLCPRCSHPLWMGDV